MTAFYNKLVQQILSDLVSEKPTIRQLAEKRLRAPDVLDDAKRLLESRSQEQRLAGLHLLGIINSPQSLDMVVDTFNDRSSTVRIEAIRVLQIRAYQMAIPAIIGRLLTDESSYVRKHAAIALGEFNHPAVIGPLLEALEVDESSYVRYEAAKALGELRDETAATGLANALIDDANDYVRYAAAKALQKIGDEATIPALLVGVISDNRYIKRASIDALEKMDEDVMAIIKRNLLGNNHQLRWVSFLALMELSQDDWETNSQRRVRGRYN